MVIKVLGPGCPKCVALERLLSDMVDPDDPSTVVQKVTDYGDILAYGVLSTPALVIDEQVVLVGRVPRPAELRALLTAVTP